MSGVRVQAVLGLVWWIAACGGSERGGKVASTGLPPASVDSGQEECGPIAPLDVAGCLEVEETDPEARQRWPDILRRQYDASGNEVSRDIRGGEQPDTERVCRKEWLNGQLLWERCGGISVYEYAYAYSADGTLLNSTYDAGSDGEIDKVWTYITDADGNIVESTIDDDADGVPDAAQTFAWNGAGQLIEETWDYTYDGGVDYRRTLEWSGALLISETVDDNGDGVVDQEQEWTYDELDRPIESFVYNDGSSSAAETTRWEYVNCLLDRRVVSDAGGNRVEYLYTHDDMGRQSLLVEDFGGDGTPDRVWATEWICPGG